MRILWLCNICLPKIAEAIGRKTLNKEGWLAGLADTLLAHKEENGIELAVCFPVPLTEEAVSGEAAGITYYSFHEDMLAAHEYHAETERELAAIEADFMPEVIHIFGTEYPHTLAMLNCCKDKSRVLVGIQGLCFEYAKYYMADMPKKVQNGITFRDWYKKDTIKKQQEKYVLRGQFEIEALKKAEHITGRTKWDERLTKEVNPSRRYYFMNETLRSLFYQDKWKKELCEKHSIFVSQGNYPIKGLHYVIPALSELQKEFEDIRLYVAGDIVTAYQTVRDKIKLSAYGKYLRTLMKQYNVEERIVFTGSLNAEEMKKRFLKSNVFLSPSAIENSPNSVGEAMLLGVPTVSSRVGGVESILTDKEEGLLYEASSPGQLADCIRRIFTEDSLVEKITANGVKRAEHTHNAAINYKRLLEIYREIGE